MCRYCIEYLGMHAWTEGGYRALAANPEEVVDVETMLSFRHPGLPDPNRIAESLYARAPLLWRQTSVVLCALDYGEERVESYLTRVVLPDGEVLEGDLSRRRLGAGLERWYDDHGHAVLRQWRDHCEADEEPYLSSLIMLAGLFRHRALSVTELRACRAIAGYRPPAGGPRESMAHWLRRQYRLLLWQKGYHKLVAGWDSGEEYAITLRVLTLLRKDHTAARWLRRRAPRQWREDQQ